jgi:sulfite reductase (NADPH) hemoprotein beta-component
LHVPDEEIARIESYFAPPQYERIDDETRLLATQRTDNPDFDRWLESNTVEHKIPGYSIVNLILKSVGMPPGDMDADTMDAVADLADQYSFGEIRVSHRQNLSFVDVRQRDLFSLWQALDNLKLARPVLDAISDIICCPGLDYCALANARSIPVADDINRRFMDVDELADIGELKINISGCMNACGHHHVGHIGILGVDKRGKEYFQLTLGGSSDQNASLGDRLGPGLPQEDVPDAIAAIVERYKSLRNRGERFLDTYRRVGIEPFKEAVYVSADEEVA